MFGELMCAHPDRNSLSIYRRKTIFRNSRQLDRKCPQSETLLVCTRNHTKQTALVSFVIKDNKGIKGIRCKQGNTGNSGNEGNNGTQNIHNVSNQSNHRSHKYTGNLGKLSTREDSMTTQS